MRGKIWTILYIIMGTSSVFANGNGKTGLAFLKIGVGGHAVGMGEAFTTIVEDASAAYWNPAALMNTTENNFFAMHNEWLQNIRTEYIGLQFAGLHQSLALSINLTSVDDIEQRIIPSEEPLSTFQANDVAIGVSYARKATDKLSLGITAKYILERIFVEEAVGFALDFGAIYRTPIESLKIAVVLLNAGRTGKLKEERITLPLTVKIGAGYVKKSTLGGKFIIASDIIIPVQGNFHWNWGGEYYFGELFALRTGYQFGFDDKGLSAGIGIPFRSSQLDYGYVPFSSDIGETHRISFRFSF